MKRDIVHILECSEYRPRVAAGDRRPCSSSPAGKRSWGLKALPASEWGRQRNTPFRHVAAELHIRGQDFAGVHLCLSDVLDLPPRASAAGTAHPKCGFEQQASIDPAIV
jgi:hypothetical protein